MKRYLLFAGPSFCPGGGWQDFFKSFDTLEEAVKAGNSLILNKAFDGSDWFHVVDATTMSMVKEKYNPH